MANPKPPDIDYLFPIADLKMPVGPWAKLAFIPGGSRDVAKRTTVKAVTHYKSRRGKEHEKLLVELSVPRPESQEIITTYIITERGPDPDDKRESSDFSTGPSPNPSSASLQLGIVQAADRVVVPGTRKIQSLECCRKHLHKSYDALCTVAPTVPMSLAQLAILMKVVNEHSIEYDMKYQCYWYAYTVWEIIRTHFEGDVTDNTLEGRRGKYMGVRIRREDSVQAITEIFATAWRAHCEEEIVEEKAIQRVIREAEARGEARERAKWEAKHGPLGD